MSPTQEMVMTLFTKETIDKVKNQFINGPKILPVDSFDMSFRLFKPSPENINLEILVQTTVSNEGEADFGELGRGQIKSAMTFFKPIGFFTLKKGSSSNEIEITVVKEFENELDTLIRNGDITPSNNIHKLSLRENAVLAAFSMETYLEARKYEDASLQANGLFIDIYMTFEGQPQIFLDDRHNLSGPIGIYFLREHNTINPIVEYKELFDKFSSMELLTAFKNF